MIISHKHKFIFIKIRKTASSSIEAALAAQCGKDDIITPMPTSPEHSHAQNWEKAAGGWKLLQRIPELMFWRNSTIQNYKGMSQKRQILLGNFYNHMRAVDIKACISPYIWNSYFKFCCERNPWDKLLSRYAWQHRDTKLPNGISAESFTTYLKQNTHASPSLSDYPFYTDRGGKLLVDKIIRFENLSEDFAEVANKLGIAAKLDLKLKQGTKASSLAENSTSPNKDYRKFYTQEQKQLVAKACAKEIELLGYEF